MTASALIMDGQACFQFKTSFAPCAVLQITDYDLDKLSKDIADAINKAPKFFLGSPIVVDLDKIQDQSDIDFVKLKKILTSQGLVPVGVRGGSEIQQQNSASVGMPALTIGRLSALDTQPPSCEPEKTAPLQPIQTSEQISRIMKGPIRSGSQIYARNTDLIILGSVSAGAELIADGHIHVYGSLRGRAIAGARGNVQASIFCKALKAELIAIAGHYMTQEEMPVIDQIHDMIQIHLVDDHLKVEPII